MTKTKKPVGRPRKPPKDDVAKMFSRVVAEMRTMDRMDAVVAAHEKRTKRCSCCFLMYDRSDTDPTCKPFVEAWDGKLFCPACAFAVIPTGHCTLHRATHYEDVAALVPQLDELEYPDEFVIPELKAALRKRRAEEKNAHGK